MRVKGDSVDAPPHIAKSFDILYERLCKSASVLSTHERKPKTASDPDQPTLPLNKPDDVRPVASKIVKAPEYELSMDDIDLKESAG